MEIEYAKVEDNIQVCFTKCGESGKMSSVHYHDSYEIYILEKGNRTYIIDDTLVELSDRDIALIKPYAIHTTDGGVYSRYLLYFDNDYLEKFFAPEAKERLVSCFEYKKIHINHSNYEKLKTLLMKVKNEKDNFIIFCEILELISESSKNYVPLVVSERNRLISNIIEYIGKNYRSIESLEKIADEFFITKYYLCRLFKKETGIQVIKYINTLKLQDACEMLAETKESIEGIAQKCGFNSSMYFCKLFKAYMGMRPGEYRKLKGIN